MFKFPNIQFDRISFLLGFIAATLLWWVISRFRPLMPFYWEKTKKFFQRIIQENQQGVEQVLRKHIIRRSQNNHLANSLFALDEILIPPRLVVPPPINYPGDLAFTQTIADQTLPYLPDWPELTSPLGISTLTPIKAISRNCHIAIIGQPGSGKTVALNALACQLARKDTATGDLQNALPLYTHIADFDLTGQTSRNPLDVVNKAVVSSMNLVVQPQLTRYINQVFREGNRKIILMIDGLDEIASGELHRVIELLKILINRLPTLQVVVTGSPEYLDGLMKLGFYPLAIAAWSTHEKLDFLQKWDQLWNNLILPEVRKRLEVKPVDPLLIRQWLMSELSFENPLELTLKTWAAYCGDLNGTSFINLIDNYLSRVIQDNNVVPSLANLSSHMVKNRRSWMVFDDMEKFLSEFATQSTSSKRETELVIHSRSETATNKKGPNQKTTSTRGEKIISLLESNNLMVFHNLDRVRFIHPIFVGYLSSLAIDPNEINDPFEDFKWTIYLQTLRFLSASAVNPPWVRQLMQAANPPLFSNLLILSRWLADVPPNTEWRNDILRSLVNHLQDPSLTLGTHARIITAFLLSRDPSTPKLLRQLMRSPIDSIRQVTVMAFGALGQPAYLSEILGSLGDINQAVRNTACLAISAIPGDTALNALSEVLMQGDEETRQAAAEALVLNATEGKQLLEEIIVSVDNLLARRAAIYGLVQVKDSWSQQLLEKIAVEDGQWVIRTAATNALEEIRKPENPYIPQPLPPPSENPWLLTYASTIGLGIRPDRPATDVLMAALKTGTNIEKIAALSYLRNEPDEEVISVILSFLAKEFTPLHDQALTALWWIGLSGYHISITARH